MFSLSLQKEQDLTDLVRRRNRFDERSPPPQEHIRPRVGDAANEYSASAVFLTSVFSERARSVSRRNSVAGMGQAGVGVERSSAVDRKSSPSRPGLARQHIHTHTLWHDATKGRTRQLRFWQEFRQLAYDEMERDGFTDKATAISVHGAIAALAAAHTDLNTAVATLVMAVRELVMANLKLDLQFVHRVVAAMEPQLRVPNETRAVLSRLLRHIALRSNVSDAEFTKALPRLDIATKGKHARNVRRFSMSPTLRRAHPPSLGVRRPRTQGSSLVSRVVSPRVVSPVVRDESDDEST
jgi:hypothetical protein